MLVVFINKYKDTIIIFLISLASGFLFFLITQRYGEGGFLWSSDAEGYWEIGKNVARGKGFILHPDFGPQALRPPLYPIFIALWYLIWPSLSFIVLVQNLLSALNVVLIYILGRRFFGRNVGLIASLLFMFESQRLQVTNQIMSETLFISCFIVSIYLFLNYLEGSKLEKLAFSGIFLGMATLTKPITQFLPFVLLVFLLIYGKLRQQLKNTFLGGLIFTTAFIAVLAPWMIRNKVHFDSFGLSATGGTSLFYANAAHFLEAKARVRGEIVDVYRPMILKAITDLNWQPPIEGDPINLFNKYGAFEFKNEKYFRDETFRIISSDIPFYLKLHTRRLVAFFIDSSASRSYNAMFAGFNLPSFIFYPFLFWGGRAVWALFVGFVAVGFIFNRTWKDKALSNYILFGLIGFYFANLAGLNYDAPRMRLPINPLFFLLVADQLVRFKKREGHEDRRGYKSVTDVYKQVPADYWDTSFNKNILQRLWHRGTQGAVRDCLARLPVGAKLLDVGCGSGFTLAQITAVRPDLQVYGVDVAPHLIQYARIKRPQISFSVASGETLPFRDKEFDGLTYLDVIEHLVDVEKSLAEARRVLKDDGRLIILVVLEHYPLFRIIWWFWTHLRGKIWHGAHLRVFTKKSLQDTVEASGFKIENMKTVNFGMSVVLRASKNADFRFQNAE